ncbi:MAG: hypothetical protein NVSMB4_15160 [Acidimicrobiales bacterium]
MSNRRWINQGQPQTLVIAVFLLYFNAAFGLLAGLSQGLAGFQGPETLAVVMGGIAGYQIANERRVGYVLGLVVAASPFLLRLFYLGSPFRGADPIRLIFDVALVALLVHNQSREYQKTYFR